MSEEEKMVAEIQAASSIPVFCNACGGTTHLATYDGKQWYECDDVEGCGWLKPA